MNKLIINVPEGIEFLGQWDEFELPNGILNKEVTGCGGTTVALEDGHPTILCSPRIKMLECKHAVYPDTLMVMAGVSKEEIADYIATHETPKVLTTYDSFCKVAKVITDASEWRVVVDEFQCILSDGRFKSETEMRLLGDLVAFPYVTYLSATPILDRYLEQLPEFRDMDYYQLQWPARRRVHLHRIETARPVDAALRIVRDYQEGNFPRLKVEQGNVVESTEAVFFLNSVQSICNLIHQAELRPEDVNIIVGTDEENDRMLSRLGEGFCNSNAPGRGEEHRQFTFCTSTAYMGVDFYSTCACTFVICDCHRSNLSVDIATELPQIAGRQRLAENPFRDLIVLVHCLSDREWNEGEYMRDLDRRMSLSESEMELMNSITDPELRQKKVRDQLRLQRQMKFSDSYLYYDEAAGEFRINRVAYLSDQFAFYVQRSIYCSDSVLVRNIEESDRFDSSPELVRYQSVDEQLRCTILRTTYAQRLRAYCEYRDAASFPYNLLLVGIQRRNPEFADYYNQLGHARIRALKYREKNLQREVQNLHRHDQLQDTFARMFPRGTTLMRDEYKQQMQLIYDQYGMRARAKTSELESRFGFRLRRTRPTVPNGLRRGDLYQVVGLPE